MPARPLFLLAALAGLAACSNGVTVALGDRMLYDSREGEAGAAPVAEAPAAGGVAQATAAPAAQGGGGLGFRLPTITTNIPVYVGDQQVAGPVTP
jgi:hypothetical protein